MRNAPEEDPEFQIAPMIDILLVLLVFFMSISSTEVLQSNDAVKLPIAKDAQAADKAAGKGQTIINVLWTPLQNAGIIDIENKKFGVPADVTPELAQRIAKAKEVGKDLRILVRADKDVKYEYMRGLLKAIGQAGGTNVTFSVVNKDNAAPGAAAPAA